MNRDQLIAAIEQNMVMNPRLTVMPTERADLEITAVLTDTRWLLGKKKVEYFACLTANESEQTVVFWEMVKESSQGLSMPFKFKMETYRSDGRTRSGSVREVGWAPGSKGIDYQWDYAAIRHTVENIVKTNGWKFTTTLLKGKAMRH